MRLIAATNRDLEEDAARGKYRPDLYYRLSVFTIHLPPLRERGDDLPMLVRHYVRRFNRELGREVREVTPEAMDLLRRYPWPGNIRELQSVLKQTLLRATGPVLTADSLPAPVSAHAAPPRADSIEPVRGPRKVSDRIIPPPADCRTAAKTSTRTSTARSTSIFLPMVLQSTGGNQLRAAQLLGITRRTLRLKLRELGLSVTKTVEAADGDDLD